MGLLIGFFVFLFGIVIGSFLNVCIYRIPLGISVAKGTSRCTRCDARLTAVDLVPVLSYLVLRGKCRHCGARISPVYPVVEAATGALFLLLYEKFGLSYDTLIYAALFSLLLVISMIDLKTMIIPNGLIIFGLALGVIRLTVSIVAETSRSWMEYAIGFAAGALPLLLLAMFCAYVLKKEAVGGGDIKLMAFAGLVIGWRLTVTSYMIGTVAGAVAGLIWMAAGKKKRGDEIPFGPFLCLGIAVSVFFGYDLIRWYTGLLS